MLLFKLLVVIVFLSVVAMLFSALFFLNKDKGRSTRTLTLLKWRIGLSVVLFVMLIVGYFTGLIQPHGVIP